VESATLPRALRCTRASLARECGLLNEEASPQQTKGLKQKGKLHCQDVGPLQTKLPWSGFARRTSMARRASLARTAADIEAAPTPLKRRRLSERNQQDAQVANCGHQLVVYEAKDLQLAPGCNESQQAPLTPSKRQRLSVRTQQDGQLANCGHQLVVYETRDAQQAPTCNNSRQVTHSASLDTSSSCSTWLGKTGSIDITPAPNAGLALSPTNAVVGGCGGSPIVIDLESPSPVPPSREPRCTPSTAAWELPWQPLQDAVGGTAAEACSPKTPQRHKKRPRELGRSPQKMSPGHTPATGQCRTLGRQSGDGDADGSDDDLPLTVFMDIRGKHIALEASQRFYRRGVALSGKSG